MRKWDELTGVALRRRAGRARRQTAREIASALAYLHSLDILHGDLSGGNILLASSNKDPRGFVAKARPCFLKIRAVAGQECVCCNC